MGRHRPPVAHLVVATHLSFPSGHATLSAAFYVALAIVFLTATPRRAVAVASVIATGLLVVGIALSRVYLGVHYPSHVVSAALLGASWTLLAARKLAGHRRRPRTASERALGSRSSGRRIGNGWNRAANDRTGGASQRRVRDVTDHDATPADRSAGGHHEQPELAYAITQRLGGDRPR